MLGAEHLHVSMCIKLNAGPLRERGVVPRPYGGYVMVIREIKV